MATLSNFGIPGVGSGVLLPKLRNKFRILFFVEGQQVADILSAQVLSVEGLPVIYAVKGKTENASKAMFQIGDPLADMGIEEIKQVEVTFEDDVANGVSQCLYELMDSKEVEMKIQTLDGTESALDEFYLIGVKVDQIHSNGYNYALRYEDTGYANMNLSSKAAKSVEENPELGAFAELLESLHINWRNTSDPQTVRKTVYFSYTKAAHVFYKHKKETK